MTPEQKELIEKWQVDMKLIFQSHYACAVASKNMNYWLGIPVAILSVVTGTTVFSTVGDSQSAGDNPSVTAKIIVGCVSMLAAILASLQTFMRCSETAEKYRIAGAKFASLSKEVNQVLVCPPSNEGELIKWMTGFRERWDALSLDAPTIDPRIWNETLLKVQRASAQQPGTSPPKRT